MSTAPAFEYDQLDGHQRGYGRHVCPRSGDGHHVFPPAGDVGRGPLRDGRVEYGGGDHHAGRDGGQRGG